MSAATEAWYASAVESGEDEASDPRSCRQPPSTRARPTMAAARARDDRRRAIIGMLSARQAPGTRPVAGCNAREAPPASDAVTTSLHHPVRKLDALFTPR